MTTYRKPALDRPVRSTNGRQKPRLSIAYEPIDFEMIKEAARLTGLPRNVWVRRTLAFEALRTRQAATNLPHRLVPDAPIFFMRKPPIGGVWSYTLVKRATGKERVWVSSFIEDAPPHVARDGKALVVDLMPPALVDVIVNHADLRWLAPPPFGVLYWPKQLASCQPVDPKPRTTDKDQEEARVESPPCQNLSPLDGSPNLTVLDDSSFDPESEHSPTKEISPEAFSVNAFLHRSLGLSRSKKDRLDLTPGPSAVP